MAKSFFTQKKYFLSAIGCLLAIAGITYYYLFTALSVKTSATYVYIDNDDNIDSVYSKVGAIANEKGLAAFKTLARHTGLAGKIRSGRYEITPQNGAFTVLRKIKNGLQAPVNLTIPSVRTLDRLADEVSARMMFSKAEFMDAVTDEATCRKYGYTKESIISMFVPNTYSLYWNTSVDKFLDKMQQENRKFWTFERKNKAKAMGLSPVEVVTMASIVDEETANNAEKPMIAGMYYNRLKSGMPLQADPTVKFALKKFELKRIYNNMLSYDSPYNTYRYKGLPPGPIRIPTVEGIDAVLNYVHHDYLYMCAKEDFSGTHNFARTYEEHKENARKYTKALNERGIN